MLRCCELLSNLYLCIGWHSRILWMVSDWSVVNCFQICIFVSDDTALNVCTISVFLLWIAFKFVSLYRMTQPCAVEAVTGAVVNCFQICIFVSDDTAGRLGDFGRILLWIAFKFVSLYRMTQHSLIRHYVFRGCELLSNLYLCIGWHSKATRIIDDNLVVNCFQICIFVSDDTAIINSAISAKWLWIAFKFVSLYRMTQRITERTFYNIRCELLSNLYLCIGWHSAQGKEALQALVVNCFQICIFVSDDTAMRELTSSATALWIAFKFVSLYRMTQHIKYF